MHDIDAAEQRKRFLIIVDELRVALGYSIRDMNPDPAEDLVMEMMYGNFDFSVVHSKIFCPEKILIECEFDDIPESRKGVIITKLLEMNSVLAELDGSVFCLDQDNCKLVYVLPMRLSLLDGKLLLSKMTEIIWHGRRWQETRYMKYQDKGELLNPIRLA